MADGILIAARLLAYVLLLLAAGLPIHRLTQGQRTAGAGQRKVQAVLALAAMAVTFLWAVASVAVMAASPIAALDPATVQAVLGATPLGGVLLARFAALAILLLATLAFARNAAMAMAAGVALVTCAWTGHAGAGEGFTGMAHQFSDAVHLLAAAAWIGALMCFLEETFRGGDSTGRVLALSRFARVGTVIVTLLAVTGIANGFLVTVSAGWSPRSAWSLLIGAKIMLFVAMLALAAANRWWLVPALAAGRPGAPKRLARSLLMETACAIGIVVLVALAGVLDPSGG
ncbi:putative copper resistance protein D [Novosphingobium sp. CF614]|uniref:copper homeostasis membrane protein CopD n=1 Tax=Novosphingobium sp. CF614 TaxID=1884364 RepID=UPI0008F2C868|nr:copper homeostasis membrane protein CopD [Novosphingobium sp. CF614]SFG11608.1 putative copper resistance protein D [Novosphingobium sp. CF614]